MISTTECRSSRRFASLWHELSSSEDDDTNQAAITKHSTHITQFDHLDVEPEEECKIVVIGDPNVGKTKLVRRIGGDGYFDFYIKTLGLDYENVTVTVFGCNVSCKITDTSGQQRFEYLNTTHLETANVVIFVYNIADYKTFQNIKTKWFATIKQILSSDCVSILVGNQCDAAHLRNVSYKTAKRWADINGMLFIETSAKENINMDTLLQNTVQQFIIKQDLSVIRGENVLYLNSDTNISAIHHVISGLINAPFVKLLWKNAINHPLCLDIQLMYDMVQNDACIHRICDIIQYFAKQPITELRMENLGVIPVYDIIKRELCRKLTKCSITTSPFAGLTHDYTLYGVALRFVEHFECDIDACLLDEWIKNDEKQWDSVTDAIENNPKLTSLKFNCNISNDGSKDAIYERKLCALLFHIEEHVQNLTRFQLSFANNIHDCNQLHVSLLECIASKHLQISTLSLTSQVDSLLNHVFYDALLSCCTFPNIQRLLLDNAATKWNDDRILSICHIVQNSKNVQEVVINGILSINNKTMKELIRVLNDKDKYMKIENISLKIFDSNINIETLCDLVKNPNEIQSIKLGFDRLSTMDAMQIIEAFTEFLRKKDAYYKALKLCLSDTLNILYVKTRNIIYEYIEVNKYEVCIYSNECIKPHLYVFEINHLMKLFKIQKYDDIKPHLLAVKDSIARNGDIHMNLKHEACTNRTCAAYESCSAHADYQEYHQLKWDYLSCIDHKILVYGFISKYCVLQNTIIPHAVCNMICDYYPCFDLLSLDMNDILEYRDLNTHKWLHTSSVLDRIRLSTLKRLKQHPNIFKSMDNLWYNCEWIHADEIDKASLFDASDFEHYFSTLSNTIMMNELSRDIDRNNMMQYIDILSSSPFRDRYNDLIVCCSKMHIYLVSGSVYHFYSVNEAIIDVQIGNNHALFLTQSGSVRGFGTDLVRKTQIQNELRDIKSIHVGAEWNFCINMNHDVYCFGLNAHNIFGLNADMNDEEISPMLHPDFSGKNITEIKCGYRSCILMNKRDDCFMTGDLEDNNKILNLTDIIQCAYGNNVYIVNGAIYDKSDTRYFFLIDNENHLIMFPRNLIMTDMQRKSIKGIEKHTIIQSVYTVDNQLFLIVS